MQPTDKVRRFYDAMPCERPGRITLSTPWLERCAAPGPPPIRAGARALVAGCGTGSEAMDLRRLGMEVVGIDISARSIERARALSDEVTWIHGDLQHLDQHDALGPFDLVLCHAVADYVPDSAALLRGMADTLTPHGLILLSTNTPHHPRQRLLDAWRALGGENEWHSTDEERARLDGLGDVLGPHSGIGNLRTMTDDIVRMDLFPPLAHHRSAEQWCALAADVGLHLRGDRHIRDLVLAHPDPSVFGGLPLTTISTVAQALVAPPSSMLLFAREPAPVLALSGESQLVTTASVPVGAIPPAEGPWDESRSLHMVDSGVTRELRLTTLGLEMLRLCDGRHTLGDLGERLKVDWRQVEGELIRMLYADLLHPVGALTP
ncbi:MAG: class I SAM-dependent methyltransferase [Deltaproteobacteria bacterium]|nr:MAG: class I SAM-dependent methyltransferase [Deltaproteobacteria bacterium]